MYHHRETIKSIKRDETMKMALNSELKKTPSWAKVGPAKDKHQAPTHRWKF